MRSLTLALLLCFTLIPAAHADGKPDPGIDETDPPHADSYGPTAPACASDGKDISTDPAAILEAIQGAQFCWQAVILADSCSSGDGDDLAYLNAATPICQQEFTSHNPTVEDKALLASLLSACDAKWKDKDGSQHESENALCKLKAESWMANLTKENAQ